MIKRIIISGLLCILVITYIFSTVDIYISDLVVLKSDSSNIENEEEEYLSSLFQEELIKTSSNSISYKTISTKGIDKLGGLNIDKVTTSLDALAVCFFQGIEYLIYGTIVIEGDNNQYSTSIKLYSKDAHKIIYEKNYTNVTTSKESYIAELANIINQEVSELFEKIEKGDIVLTEERTFKPIIKQDEPINIGEDEEDKKIKDNAKIFAFSISIGYYFPFMGKWMDILIPCTSIESGVKFGFVLADTDGFDLLLRPGIFFNYSFAINKPQNYIVHYHSLAGKIGLELYFEFSDFFAFSLGGGPQYKFDIIDRQTPSGGFWTDLPYAFGVFANLGIEFILGDDGAFSIGINNILDITFFNETNIEYKILIHFLFKV